MQALEKLSVDCGHSVLMSGGYGPALPSLPSFFLSFFFFLSFLFFSFISFLFFHFFSFLSFHFFSFFSFLFFLSSFNMVYAFLHYIHSCIIYIPASYIFLHYIHSCIIYIPALLPPCLPKVSHSSHRNVVSWLSSPTLISSELKCSELLLALPHTCVERRNLSLGTLWWMRFLCSCSLCTTLTPQ